MFKKLKLFSPIFMDIIYIMTPKILSGLTVCFFGYLNIMKYGTSGQDGGIGRHTVPPRTTTRRTTTIQKQRTTRTDRKSNCIEGQQPRR